MKKGGFFKVFVLGGGFLGLEVVKVFLDLGMKLSVIEFVLWLML